MRKILLGAAAGLCIAAAALPVPLWAQWSGDVGVGYVWQSSAGNEDTFITQFGEKEGFLLDDFTLAYSPKPGQEIFSIKGYGFGNAEPSQHGAILFKPNGDWTFRLNYDSNAAFYSVASGDASRDSSRWTIERWKGQVLWNGWSFARLTLDLSYYKKGGHLDRPIYGQRNAFPIRNNFNSDMREAAVRIETKTLPVYISFEQAFSQYRWRDRWQANDGGQAIFPPSFSRLDSVETQGNSKTNVPASRLILAYRNDWVDVAGSAFYSRADMDATPYRLTVYDIAPNAGQFQWLDQTLGSATQDTKVANVDAAFHLGSGWSIRLAGDYNNATQNSSLIGAKVLTLGQPGTYQVFTTPVSEYGFFDIKDTLGKVELEKRGEGWAVFAGYQGQTRDVSYKREDDDTGFDVSRSGHGWYMGGAWSRTPVLRINAEYEHGTFDNYSFRTDPDMIDRFTVKLSSSLGGGWTLGARARWDYAENEPRVARAKRAGETFGANVAWSNSAGTGGFGLSADTYTLNSTTNILYPGGAPGWSLYDLDMYTLTANGYFTIGKIHVSTDLTKVRDAGSSWPLESWGGNIRAAIDGPKGTQFVVFGQYNSFNQDWSTLDNYYVKRYGVIIRWRF